MGFRSDAIPSVSPTSAVGALLDAVLAPGGRTRSPGLGQPGSPLEVNARSTLLHGRHSMEAAPLLRALQRVPAVQAQCVLEWSFQPVDEEIERWMVFTGTQEQVPWVLTVQGVYDRSYQREDGEPRADGSVRALWGCSEAVQAELDRVARLQVASLARQLGAQIRAVMDHSDALSFDVFEELVTRLRQDPYLGGAFARKQAVELAEDLSGSLPAVPGVRRPRL